MKLKLLSALCAGLLFTHNVQAKEVIVTAKQVNGTWSLHNKSQDNALTIRALGGQKLKIEFNGAYTYKLPDGSPTANIGLARSIAEISGNTAIFYPYPVEKDGCQIILKFVGKNLHVQTLDENYMACGFGHNVTADGVYRKSSKKISFSTELSD